VYDRLGFPKKWKKRGNGQFTPTADKEAIEELALEHDSPILNSIVEIRSAQHQISTNLQVDCDAEGYVHPRFGVSTAATGRFNSWDPNAQNIPVVLREIYIPDTPDHIFLSSDWSQIEWRLQVILSGDPVGLQLLTSGRDNHTAVAAEILGKRYEDVTTYDGMLNGQYSDRYRAKFVVHGLGYGRGAESIAKQYGLPLHTVKDFVQRFASRFSVFWKWRDSLVEDVGRTTYLRNPFGRRRWWFTRQVTEIYNFLAQSTGADMMHQAVILNERQNLPGALRATVHDDLLLCVHRSDVRRAAEGLRDIMNMKWPQIVEASARPDAVRKAYPTGWACPADISLGRNWAECKNKKQQAALRKEYGL
jgi:DNA polymerase-1